LVIWDIQIVAGRKNKMTAENRKIFFIVRFLRICTEAEKYYRRYFYEFNFKIQSRSSISNKGIGGMAVRVEYCDFV
jgi:hypothetical protein